MTLPLLQIEDLTKCYGNVTVLRDVTLDVRAGEIHALLGANGAGKSTLCKIISGLVRKSAGTMTFAGSNYEPPNKQHAEQRGVEIVHQELNLISTLSVAENLFLTRLPSTAGVIHSRRLHHQARKLLDRFGMSSTPTHTLVSELGIGRQQMVEIAGALGRQCKLLILDEPTAALSSTESLQLFKHLHTLRDEGVAIIYVSHRLDEVAQICDRITVLRDGALVATKQTDSLTTDDMIDLMSGQIGTSARAVHISHVTDKVALRVEALECGPVNDVSFTLRRGERLGITGLVGSGRTELLRAIFGADVAQSGFISIGENGKSQLFTRPEQAVAAGLAMVTEDRKENGLLLSQSVRVNTTLSSLKSRFSRGGLLRLAEEESVAEAMRNSLETHCQSIQQLVGTLSGGNQQKVAVAKWLVRDAEIFLFDEPTRGIDVAARRRIYRLFESLASEGKAMVIVSSDLDELFETCDRIAVMSNGRLVKVIDRDPASPDSTWDYDTIMQASFSGYTS